MCYNWGMSEKENGEYTAKKTQLFTSETSIIGKDTQFNSETGRQAGINSGKSKRMQKAYKEVAQETLEKVINKGALDDLISNFAKLKKVEQLAILEHLADYSGQKPKDEPQTIIMPSINIKGI